MHQHDGTLIENVPPFEGKRSPKLSEFLGHVINVCVLGLAALIPVWFLPISLDILELNKQTLLVMGTLIAVIAWVGKSILDREFTLSRSWLHLVVSFYLVGYAITTFFSIDPYLSFVGNVGQMQWSLVTIASCVFLYFVIVNHFKKTGRVYDALLWFILGSVVAGLYGILQLFNVHLFGGALATNGFNTIGTANALATFLAIPTVIAASLTVLACTERSCYLGQSNRLNVFWKVVLYAMISIGALVSLIVDFWVSWVAMLFGMVLIVAIRSMLTKKICTHLSMIVPAILIVLSVIFLLAPTPINVGIPAEVSPSLGHTWQIAKQVLRDTPLFGSGPGTWIYDYAQHRSLGVNVSQFWTIRFERGITAFFTMIAMLGLVGTALWLILLVSGMVKSAMHLSSEKQCDTWLVHLLVFTGWSTTALIAFLYNFNIAHQFAFWFLLALIGALVSEGTIVYNQKSKGWVVGLLSGTLIIVAVAAISSTWLMGQRLAADAAYSSAVRSFQKGESIDVAIKHLNTAVNLNKWNDVYYRNLSQAYLVKVGQLLEAEPTEELVNEVNAQVAQAVDAAKRASEIAPANVDSYSNLAIVYQSIASFTRGADEFAIKNYEEALVREPNNPVFMNEVGKLYVLRSDAYRTLLESPDEEAKATAQQNVDAELNNAATWFNKAITAKPDYAAAHFNLGLVYERQGRLPDSIRKFEEVLNASPSDIGVAFQLAILYYRNGDKEASRTLFEQIVQQEPGYANARWFLASLYEEEGNYDLAIEQVEEVKKSNPENADIEQRLEALKRKKVEKAEPESVEIPLPIEEDISGPDTQNPIQP